MTDADTDATEVANTVELRNAAGEVVFTGTAVTPQNRALIGLSLEQQMQWAANNTDEGEEDLTANCGGKGGKPGPCPEGDGEVSTSQFLPTDTAVAARFKVTKATHTRGTVEKVKISSLIATQDTVTKETIRDYVQNPTKETNGGLAFSGVAGSKPLVVEQGGKRYLLDGHHRVVAAKLRGDEDIEVRIIRVPTANAEWVDVDNCGGKGGKPGPCDRTPDKAKFVGKRVGAAEHLAADKTSNKIAKALGGKTEEQVDSPGQKDKKPFDVRVGKHDIEVKTLIKGGKQAISVHEDALLRKVDHALANPENTFHTVVADIRNVYEKGAHKASYSGHGLYYKRGSGRYALSQMHKVSSAEELKKLVEMKDDELPEKARGTLPPPPPLDKLRETAAKASESRKARDKARKLANKDLLAAQAKARAEKAKAKK